MIKDIMKLASKHFWKCGGGFLKNQGNGKYLKQKNLFCDKKNHVQYEKNLNNIDILQILKKWYYIEFIDKL